MRLPDAAAFYADVGARLAGRLTCEVCGRVQELSAADAARYLDRGWPKCCGQTMAHSSAPAANVKRRRKGS